MKLTKEEKEWVKGLNKHLSACPSHRLGFATIGDHSVFIFDQTRRDEIDKSMDRGHGDFIPTATKLGLVADETIDFPSTVESTAG